MPRKPGLLAAVLVVLAAACTGGSQATSTTVTSERPPTTAAVTTTGQSTSTTAGPSTSTTEGMPPGDAVGATSMQADVDGDGRADTVHAYTSATGFRTLAVELSSDGTVSAQLPSPPATPPELAGAPDLGGVGHVILVRLDTGSTTSFLVPYRLDAGELVQVSDAGEEFVSFTVGSDSLSREGVQCRMLEDLGPVIVSRDAVSEGAGVFTVTETTFHLEEGALVQAADPEQYELDATADAEALDAIAAVDCPAAG